MSARFDLGRALLVAALAAAGIAACRACAPEASWTTRLLLLGVLGFVARPYVFAASARGRLAGLGERLVAAALTAGAGALLEGAFRGAGWAGAAPALWVLAALLVVAVLRPGTAARLLRLLHIEGTKLVRTRLFALSAVACVLVTLLSAWLHEPLDGESGWTLAATALGTGLWAAEVFLLVLGATTIAGEQAQGTLKMVLPHAYRRSEWIAAKALVLLLAAGLFGALVYGTVLIHGHAGPGLGDVTKTLPPGFGESEGSTEVFRTADVMGAHLRATFLVGLASVATSALLGLFFSCILEGLVAALSATFLLFLGLKSADVLLGISRDVMQHVYSTAPETLRTWTAKLGQGLNETWSEAVFAQGLVLCVVTGAVAVLVAIGVFGRRDLHG